MEREGGGGLVSIHVLVGDYCENVCITKNQLRRGGGLDIDTIDASFAPRLIPITCSTKMVQV